MNAYILSITDAANLQDQWDFGLVKDLLEGKLWRPPYWKDIYIKTATTLKKEEEAIVLIAARHHKELEQEVNKEINKLKKCILFLMGDEEADFDINKIKHENIYIWVQNPHIGKHDNYYRLGTGYPQHIHSNLPDYTEKDTVVYFSGQVTHQRREELIEALQMVEYTKQVNPTEGFTQGEEPKDYYYNLSRAKIAPAPSGAVIPDSFRLFEALECMAIPIADQKTAKGETMEYWDWLFGEITPFPKVNNWFVIETIIDEVLLDYPHNIHKQTQWWIHYKRKIANILMDQVYG